jgi:hypothetical protein
MKRTILAVAAVLALGSASAYAQTSGVQPSFNDAPDLAAIAITGNQTVDQHLPKGSMNSGGPRGPASVVLRSNDLSSAQYAHASAATGGTRSDATVVDGNDSGLAPTLNDTMHYPSSD